MSSIPISNAKTLDGIRVRKQNRNPHSIEKPRTIVSVDTETDEGDIFLIADSSGNKLELNEISLENVVEFLLDLEGCWVFFYNLDHDAGCILKLLPKEILMTYKWKKELRFEYGPYHIHYFDRKKLTIRKGHHSVNCYDIAQYYDKKSLLDAYQENIKKPLDPEYPKMKKKREFFTKYYYSRHKKQVRKYCIQDCIYTKELAEWWVRTFYGVFGFYPDNWISSGYLAEKVLINYGIDVPFFNEISYSIQELARSSFYGGRFELIQRGYIGKCYLYDINSAYPHALTTLPDITKGMWVTKKKIHPKAKIGFFYILANVDDSVKIAPFPFIKKNKTICYPCGKFRTYVTLDELRMVKSEPKIKYKILESWQFIPSKNCVYPFKDFVAQQYLRRLKLQNNQDPLERTIKVVLNSIYGKTAQRTNRLMGNLFNPVIASYITGFTRARLYHFMKENNLENDVIAFATDSVACQKKIPILNSNRLGEMKLDKEGDDVIFLSNGFYRFNGIWKRRGIGYDKARKLEIDHIGQRIDKDGKFYLLVKTTRTTHIKSGILYNKLKDVGKIEKYEKKIDLNSDRKRVWFSELKSINDKSHCDSAPIPADIVADLISKEDVEWYYGDEKYEPESDL